MAPRIFGTEFYKFNYFHIEEALNFLKNNKW